MESYLKEAVEIVKAQAGVRHITEEEILDMVRELAQGIQRLSENMEKEEEVAQNKPDIEPMKAIREKSVICLECGKKFKVLTKRHLATHGLSTKEYKERYGYKNSVSLVAKELARQRRNKMQEMQLWKRRKSHGKKSSS
jgi:predicted transcriptional regulator